MNAKLLAQPEIKKPLTINRDALKLAHEKVVDSYINSYLLAGARGLSTDDIITLAESVEVITGIQSAQKAPPLKNKLAKFVSGIGMTALVASNFGTVAPLSLIMLTVAVTGYSTLKMLKYELVNDEYDKIKSQDLGSAIRNFNDVFSRLPEDCKQDDRCTYVAYEIREAIKTLRLERTQENFENAYSKLHQKLAIEGAFFNKKESELLHCATQMQLKRAIADRLTERLLKKFPARLVDKVTGLFSPNKHISNQPATLMKELKSVASSINTDLRQFDELLEDYLDIPRQELGLNHIDTYFEMVGHITSSYEKQRSDSLTDNYSKVITP